MKLRVGIIICILFIGFLGQINAVKGALNIDVVSTALDGGCTRVSIRLTDEEYEILCRIVEAEATGGNVEQKMNVASCVIARVQSKSWANTIKGVVFEHTGGAWQFTPVSDGRYYTVSITDTTRAAVDNVLQNGKTHNCQFFCSYASYEKKNSWHRNKLKYVFKDGEHVYCNP